MPHVERPSAEPLDLSPGRVLVVDDDAAMGVALRVALKPYQVTFAQSAAGALARVQAGGEFVAVVCDVHMPGMTGMEFHEELRRIHARLAERIVFVTGGAMTSEAQAFLRDTTFAWIQKPFTRERLQAAVAAAALR